MTCCISQSVDAFICLASGHRNDAVTVLIPYRHLHPFVVQNLKPASVHDIMDYPWPCDSASRKVFEKALAESVKLERIKPMHVLKVSTWVRAVYGQPQQLLWYSACDEIPKTFSKLKDLNIAP